MDSAKLQDEMFEKRSRSEQLEAGLGEEDEKMMRRVVFKMDVRYISTCFYICLSTLLMVYRILPILALLFLCSFIDRTNVGNAKILGLQKDIHINDHQYAIGLCVFYATYISRYV